MVSKITLFIAISVAVAVTGGAVAGIMFWAMDGDDDHDHDHDDYDSGENDTDQGDDGGDSGTNVTTTGPVITTLSTAPGITTLPTFPVITTLATPSSGCIINPFEADPHPLIVRSGSSDWIYPIGGESVLRFENGESLDFLCPGRNVIIDTTSTGQALLTGTCASESTFLIDGAEVEWNTLSCSSYPWKDIITTGNTCAGDGKELQTGFNTGDGRFLVGVTICFNPTLEIAYYTFINQTAAINQRVEGTPRPSFLQGSGIYTIGTVTNLYLRAQQRATINSLLGLEDTSEKYIQDTGNYFLSRGHMTARSDGFYAAQQNITFYMQNMAPQWQTVNGFNWNVIEIDIRNYAEASGTDLQVWCGVHGVTTLPHEDDGEEVELYLFVNETSKLLPVPEFYWKVAYDPLTETGVAMIGLNNPYQSEYTPICEDVSSSLPWFTCQSDQANGFCYACSVDSFRQVVTVLPDFPVQGLLI